jgi:DNA-binding transcriptional regulator YiaG
MSRNTSRDHAAANNNDDEFEPDELDDLLLESAQDERFVAALLDAQNRSQLIEDLVQLRKAMSLTQSTVAERMGTTQSAVSEFENGSSDYFISTAQRYGRAVTGQVRVKLEMPCDGPWGHTRHYVARRQPSHLTATPATPHRTRAWREAAVSSTA